MPQKEIIETGRILYDRRLTVSTSGNISVRKDDCIYITSTGSKLGALSESDIIKTGFDGVELNPGKKASSEKKLHLEIYKKRPDVSAIIHVHPVFLTSFAACEKPLNAPVMSESILYFRDIPVVPYFMPSSDELAIETAKYFDKRDVVLMANHGAVAAGKTLDDAFQKIETAEYYAQVLLNIAILGTPRYLTEEEINNLSALKKSMSAKS